MDNNVLNKKELMMKFAKMTAMALALSIPGMAMAATDGTPGTTSTGTIAASLQVNAPAGPTVHIFGLDDLTFPTINRVAGQGNPSETVGDYFCIVRSGGSGNVNVTVTEASGTGPGNYYALWGAGGKVLSLVSVQFVGLDGGISSTENYGTTFSMISSLATCTASSGSGVANRVQFRRPPLDPDYAGVDGALSGVFTLTVSML